MYHIYGQSSYVFCCDRVFAENLVGLSFLWSVSYMKSIPTHGKIFAVGKSGPNAAFVNIYGVGGEFGSVRGFL